MVLGLLRPRSVMPVHGEFRMLAAHARLARDAGVPPERIAIADNGVGRRALVGRRRGSSTRSRPASPSSTGSRSATSATRRCATGATSPRTACSSSSRRSRSQNGREIAAPEVIARGFSDPDDVLDEARDEAEARAARMPRRADQRAQAAAGASPRRRSGSSSTTRTGRRPMILPGGARGLMAGLGRRRRVLRRLRGTTARLVARLRACEVAALAFCRLLDGWARGEPQPVHAPASARRRSAGRPSARRRRSRGSSVRSTATCSSSRARSPRAGPGTASPAPARSVEWEPVLRMAGVSVAPHRVSQAYLELAVLVRALEGLVGVGPLRVGSRPHVALGGPVRPPREPLRRGRRPAGARGLERVVLCGGGL